MKKRNKFCYLERVFDVSFSLSLGEKNHRNVKALSFGGVYIPTMSWLGIQESKIGHTLCA